MLCSAVRGSSVGSIRDADPHPPAQEACVRGKIGPSAPLAAWELRAEACNDADMFATVVRRPPRLHMSAQENAKLVLKCSI